MPLKLKHIECLIKAKIGSSQDFLNWLDHDDDDTLGSVEKHGVVKHLVQHEMLDDTYCLTERGLIYLNYLEEKLELPRVVSEWRMP